MQRSLPPSARNCAPFGRAVAARSLWPPARAIAAVLIIGAASVAGGSDIASSAADSQQLFVDNCGTCHAFEPGAAARAGPNLWGVVGRRVAAAEQFTYSPALAAQSFVWNRDTLDAWLNDSAALVPGSIMNYRQPDAAVRHSIIEFLANGH
jgi:cytochrome c